MSNSNITIGIDEVGRGPLAGPLVVSAVALDMNLTYCGLDDSKKLTRNSRNELSLFIKRQALGIGMGWVDAPEIDRLGMTTSLKLAAERAYSQLPVAVREAADKIVIDGTIAMLEDPRVIVLPKADAKVQAVSAASIVAKVARDRYMIKLGQIFPNYGFYNHVGYGTKAHMEALRHLGMIPGVHRTSFAPVSKMFGIRKPSKKSYIQATDGYRAETAAAAHLESLGYQIVERNWRTKLCEIDIVARKGDELYFVEVKYRKDARHGDGLDAITPQKIRQMSFAAKVYLHAFTRQIGNLNPQLMAVSMSGEPPVVEQLIELDFIDSSN